MVKKILANVAVNKYVKYNFAISVNIYIYVYTYIDEENLGEYANDSPNLHITPYIEPCTYLLLTFARAFW